MNPEILSNLVKLTGWLAAGFLFLNFLTCWAMPWAKKYCETLLKGKEIGKEEPKPLCFYHNPIAWIAIFFIITHIILAILF